MYCQHLCDFRNLVREHYLPSQQPPYLLVPPYMWHYLNIEEVFGVGDANKKRGSNDAKEEIL